MVTEVIEKKQCSKCKEEKELSEFHKRSKTTYHSQCKSCKKEYNTRHYIENGRRTEHLKKQANNRRKFNTGFVQRYKLFCGCKICGYKKTYYALELHHLDGEEKDRAVSQLKTVSIDTLKKEMRKCVVLCSNCHREIHAGLVELEQ